VSERAGPVGESAGIRELIDGLVRQNLGRDPSRRLGRRDVVAIEAVDAGVAVSLRTSDGTILVTDGRDPDARVVVSASSTIFTRLERSGRPVGLAVRN